MSYSVLSSIRRRSQNRGFTVMEVLTAIALSAVLISTVYLAIDLSWRFASAGQDEVEQVLIARTLLTRFEKDIHSLTQNESYSHSDNVARPGSSPNTNQFVSARMNNPFPSQGLDGLRIVGTKNSIVVRTPSGYEQKRDSARLHSEFVLYAVAKDGKVVLPALPSHSPSQFFRLNSSTVPSGLVRLRLLRDKQEEVLCLSDDQANAEVLAKEVMDLTLRYFDGRSWANEWGSEQANKIPLAIEITLKLVNANDTADQRGSGFETYRMVVVVPTARVGGGSMNNRQIQDGQI